MNSPPTTVSVTHRSRRLRILRRTDVDWRWRVVVMSIAIGVCILACAALFWSAGADAGTGFLTLAKGAAGSWRAISETMVKATPLIFTGLAVAVAFRARIWNIGAEGQLFAGAMMAYQFSLLGEGLPQGLMAPLVFIGGCLGGGAYGALAAVLKTRFRVDEIISTVMLNYIILFVLSYLLLNGPWSEPGSVYQQSPRLDLDERLPRLLDQSRLHLGFLLAIACAFAMHFLLKHTTLGYEIRAFGANPVASRFKGINSARMILIIMIISGMIAGMAGVSETFGIHYRLRADISAGLGYTGIIISILGRLNPFGVVVAAVFFGGLVNASVKMPIATGVPSALVYAIQATVLLFVLAGMACTRYRLRWENRSE